MYDNRYFRYSIYICVLNGVLLFSNKLIEKNYKNSNYIQDRNKIGLIYRNNEEVLKIIKLINKKKPEIKKSIVKLRKNLSNFGNVKNQISKIIYKLVLKNEISILSNYFKKTQVFKI